MRYYIADTHFFHGESIQYLQRPFANLQEMHFVFISKWNAKVTPKDEVFILGDFAATNQGHLVNQLLKQLNGKKTLITGNHDAFVNSKSFNPKLFTQIVPYLKVRDQAFNLSFRVVLSHYPIAVWECENYGTIHLYGHVHGNPNNRHPFLATLDNSYDVFADIWDYTPVSLQEIIETKGYTPKSLADAKRQI